MRTTIFAFLTITENIDTTRDKIWFAVFSGIVFEPRAHFAVWRQLADRGFVILDIKLTTRTQRAPRNRNKRIWFPEDNAKC